jgi:serine protease inhibitor
MKKLAYSLALVILLLSCSSNQADSVPEEITFTEKSAKIVDADNRFGLELFQKVNSLADEPKNIMVSPLSVSLALAMLYNGTEGDTKVQMENMLHKVGLTADDINKSYQDMVRAFYSKDPKVELSISNAIFYDQLFDVKPTFIATNKNYYQAEVEGLDFYDADATLKRVNGWVNTNTKGKIDKIIEEVNDAAVMYLLNAIYFNGEWKYRFDTSETSDMSFTKEDRSIVKVPTMHIENPFRYYSDPSFELLEMPYGSGKYSMLIFLPEVGKTANDIISLFSSENINNWVSKLTEQKKEVFLPRFEFRFEDSLVDELTALGMTDAFDASRADLSGISDAAKLVVSEVKHKSYIKVDERGTEAAAVTGITIEVTSVGPDNSFRVDHPFVFAIRENETNAILFLGKVIDPKKE